MKRLVWKLLPLVLLFAPLACGGKGDGEAGPAEAELDAEAAMIGVFARGDARLRAEEIEEGPFGPRLDFQFTYETKDAGGTLFGQADFQGPEHFYYETKTLGAANKLHLRFQDGAWNVEHSVEDPKGRKHFNYSGTYVKTDEPLDDEE